MAEGQGLGFYITTTGTKKIAKAMSQGAKVEINTAAFGSGGDPSAVWDYGRTELEDEQVRKQFDSTTDKYQVDSADASQIYIQVKVPDTYSGPVTEIGFIDKDDDLIAYSVVPDKNEGVDEESGCPIHIIYNALVKFEPEQAETVEFKILQGDFKLLSEKIDDLLQNFYCMDSDDVNSLFE